MFKQAVFTDEVSQDFQRAVDVALEYDLDGLEIRSVWDKPPQNLTSADISRMKEILWETGLEVCSIASPFFKCDLDSEEEYKEHLEILENCMNLAGEFGCHIIRGFTFWRKGSLEDNLEKILSKFDLPVKLLERQGMTLAVENEASTSIGTGRNLAKFLKRLNSPYVKAMWDPANSIYDPEREAPYPDGYEAIKGQIVHVHIKDARISPETGEPECVPVGEGDINYKGQLQALVDDGYEGYISLETHWRPVALSEEEVTRPGGTKFSELGEEASRICLENLQKIIKSLDVKRKR